MSYFSEVKIVDKETRTAAAVNDSGQLKVVLDGKVCEPNSSTELLDASESFVGEAQSILDYGIIFVSVYADADSATDGLQVQQSVDGDNWEHVDKYTIEANHAKTFSVQPHCEYLRVVYNNGATAQTEFRLSTVLKKTNSLPSSHRLSDAIVDDDDGQLTISVIKGRNPSGDYVDFASTMQGNFKISLEELENSLSVNSNTQLRITQFDSTGNEAPIGTTTDPKHTVNVGAQWISGNDGIDRGTNTPIRISSEHSKIHSGQHFTVADYALDAAKGAEIEFVMTTPNTAVRNHLVFAVSASEGATVEIYEGCSNVSGGTTVTPINNNRNSTTTSAMTLTADPTSVTEGTRIIGYLVGGERKPGVSKRDREFVLKQNTIYLFRITSFDKANDIGWEAHWYEHETQNMV